jgi:hypothetical protein
MPKTIRFFLTAIILMVPTIVIFTVSHAMPATSSTPSSPAQNSPLSTPDTPAPTPISTLAPIKAPVVIESSFTYDSPVAQICFVVRNPNTSYALSKIHYHVELFDEYGRLAGQEDGSIFLVHAGEDLGIVDRFAIDAPSAPKTLVVTLDAGTPYLLAQPPLLRIQKSTLYQSDKAATATALLSNDYPQTISNLMVTALVRNSAGVLIGGGLLGQPYIPAGATIGVAVPVTYTGAPASVEIFAAFSSTSQKIASSHLPITVTWQGQVTAGEQTVFGFTYQNVGQEAFCGVLYQITALDSSGAVLWTSPGLIGDAARGVESAQVLTYPQGSSPAAQYQIVFFPPYSAGKAPDPSLSIPRPAIAHSDQQPVLMGAVTNPFAAEPHHVIHFAALSFAPDGTFTGGGDAFAYTGVSSTPISYYISMRGTRAKDTIRLYIDAPDLRCSA